ncbi:DUF2513 domain-containing protein [Pseudomonas sp. zjy_15]|uniref:DUF2513 domain-containing protein n=1 Tax=Pseudomonas sp. zjy_15 TaxID=3367265 RepID=UPI00370CC246
MKLDKELVRDVLLAVEAHDEPDRWLAIKIPGKSDIEVSYHIMLLAEAGMLKADDVGSHDGFEWVPTRLTYKGHEFLETVRDPEIWRRTKEGAEKAGIAGLGMLVELGKAYGKQLLKERLGIDLP